MKMKHVGFTGTRNELTDVQLISLGLVVAQSLATHDILTCFHHGDCLGADGMAARLARQMDYRIIEHPPTSDKCRAWEPHDEQREAKPHLERNRAIVDESEVLIACPPAMEEILRSGTWSTIRYARKQNKPIVIVWPDGTITKENEHEDV